MEYLSAWDVIAIEAAAAGLVVASAKPLLSRLLQPKTKAVDFPLLQPKKVEAKDILPSTRRIKRQLEQTGRNCVIFYGSQTGTAERFALRLAKDASTRYNLPCLVADLENYDYDEINSLESNQVAIFILATYGEGEPTDNAISFNDFVRARDDESTDQSFSSLRYAAFGLGSSSYQFYNAMIRRTDTVLRSCGARRLGDLGLGDDGKGTLEDDFTEWKASTLAATAGHLGLAEREYEFKPDFEIRESTAVTARDVFLGEPNRAHLRNRINGPFTAQNPVNAKIVDAREIFNSPNRNCLHMEFDVSNTTLSYDTGDHLAVWPVNSDLEVQCFLRVFGLLDKRNAVIDIRSQDPTVKIPIPSPTTYETAARHYLDIAAPVGRALLSTIVTLLPNSEARSQLAKVSSDPASFRREVLDKYLTIAQLLSSLTTNGEFHKIPFSFILENVPKLQPRYYSISSSSQCSRKRISITAVVDSISWPDWQHEFKGVNTNYLLALKNNFSATASSLVASTHQTAGARGQYSEPTALVHVRRSKFRLPRSSSTPVIMIGPGTGVAPFRAFVQERAKAAESGRTVGKTILFYGCKRRDEDFLYEHEWEKHQQSFPAGTFSIHTAFSRETEKKVYVQDLIREQAAELKSLVLENNAVVYVCGDASRMAKDVFKAFAEIVEGDNVENGDSYLRGMKASGRWFEDVW